MIRRHARGGFEYEISRGGCHSGYFFRSLSPLNLDPCSEFHFVFGTSVCRYCTNVPPSSSLSSVLHHLPQRFEQSLATRRQHRVTELCLLLPIPRRSIQNYCSCRRSSRQLRDQCRLPGSMPCSPSPTSYPAHSGRKHRPQRHS
jgi:hypothetical protein